MRIPMLASLAVLAVPVLALASGHPEGGPTADEALKLLKEGSARFTSGAARHPDQ